MTGKAPSDVHFWANETPERVAAGLKAALDAMGQNVPGMRHSPV